MRRANRFHPMLPCPLSSLNMSPLQSVCDEHLMLEPSGSQEPCGVPKSLKVTTRSSAFANRIHLTDTLIAGHAHCAIQSGLRTDFLIAAVIAVDIHMVSRIGLLQSVLSDGTDIVPIEDCRNHSIQKRQTVRNVTHKRPKRRCVRNKRRFERRQLVQLRDMNVRKTTRRLGCNTK